jgi:hypothetical protein
LEGFYYYGKDIKIDLNKITNVREVGPGEGADVTLEITLEDGSKKKVSYPSYEGFMNQYGETIDENNARIEEEKARQDAERKKKEKVEKFKASMQNLNYKSTQIVKNGKTKGISRSFERDKENTEVNREKNGTSSFQEWLNKTSANLSLGQAEVGSANGYCNPAQMKAEGYSESDIAARMAESKNVNLALLLGEGAAILSVAVPAVIAGLTPIAPELTEKIRISTEHAK